MLDFDTVLADVGDFGRYQVYMYFLLCLPASFPASWTAFNQVFTAAIPDHRCNVVVENEIESEKCSNSTLAPDDSNSNAYSYERSCLQFNQTAIADKLCSGNLSELIPCENGWLYDTSTYDSTIVTEFDLVCDKAYFPTVCTMIFYIGSFIGNILFGYIADRWGRRPSFFCILTVLVVFGILRSSFFAFKVLRSIKNSHVQIRTYSTVRVGNVSLLSIFGTASAFAPDIYVFTALRFVVGLTFPALYQIPFIIGMEIMGPSGRIFAGIVVCVIFGSAMCMLGILGYFVRNWRTLTILCNAPYALLFAYWWFLPESARWLVSEKRYDEAVSRLLPIAKMNGKTVDPLQLRQKCERIGWKAENTAQSEVKHNLADLFRTPNLRKKAIIVTFVWLVNAVVYNGLTYNVRNLGVNDHFAFAINGAVEVPGYLIIWPLLDRFGRRWLLVITMLIGGIACVSCMFVPDDQPYVLSSFAFFGKFGISASFAIIYIFAGELYPTVVRAIGMGFSSMVAGSGLIMAPYLVALDVYWRILPLLIMGVLTVAAGVASMFLPETLGSHLPQTIAEAEEFGKNFAFCDCPTRKSRRKSEEDKATMELLVMNTDAINGLDSAS